MRTANALSALESKLERRFRVVETAVGVGDRAVKILHPANADELINEADFVRDERMPYWADLWPSSRVLATEMLSQCGDGRSVLELGCGAGLVSACASLAGFRVCASDYYADALLFARVNAWRNSAPEIATRLIDWRSLPDDLGQFDLVIASDVLYEVSYGALIAQALANTIAPGGEALVADPGRVARDQFIAEVARQGLEVLSSTPLPFVEGAVRQTITIFRVGWPRR